MFKSLCVLLTFLISVPALASGPQIIAHCWGAYNRDMSAGQPMEVVIDEGQLQVQPTLSSCRPAWCMSLNVAKAQLFSTDQAFTALEQRRKFGLTTFKKTVKIDFQTGQGQASHYEALESLVKAKVIYLKSCTRD